MNFQEVIESLKAGKKVAVPEWKGYWSLDNGTVMAHCADGSVVEATHFQRNIFRNDWFVKE